MLGQHPEGSAAVPGAVCDRVGIAVVVDLSASWIVEGVGNDSVVLGVKASDDGVVVGKSDAGVGRNHAIRRGGAARAQIQEVFRVVTLSVVVTKTVERDEHNVVLR